MFERNKVDNAQEPSAIPVEVALIDGATEKGKLLLPRGIRMLEALNGQGGFVEFEPYGGIRRYLSKAHIASIKPVGAPPRPNLDDTVRGDTFDPHAILGVAQEATADEIRRAFLGLSKIYHPDRYSGIELPTEVRSYLDGMARRINVAYAALEKAQPAARRVLPQRSEPIYSSSTRT